MKKILLLITVIWGCLLHPAAAANPEDILTEVIDGIHRIPLTDGRSLFGKEIYSGAERFQLDNIDSDGEAATDQEIAFRRMLRIPIKEKARWPWSKDVYYTAEEFLNVYRNLAGRACRLNPDALNFFRTLLLHGNVYQPPLPGLKESPDRITSGKWFDTVFELRFRKADATSEALIAIRDELARRAPAAVSHDDDAASGGATLRHRRPTPPTDDATIMLHEDGYSDGAESTESDPLLPKEE